MEHQIEMQVAQLEEHQKDITLRSEETRKQLEEQYETTKNELREEITLLQNKVNNILYTCAWVIFYFLSYRSVIF